MREVVEMRTETDGRAPESIESIAQELEREIKDKLSVVYYGCHAPPLQRAIALQQCESFLIEHVTAALRHAKAEGRPQLEALIVQWEDAADWEYNQGDRGFASGLDQCANELRALLDRSGGDRS